jgi:LysM repeat protein
MKKKVATAVVTVAILSGAYAGMASASTYTVQKGDTLSKIASKYKTSVKDLKAINSLKSDMIYINQTLKVTAAANTPAPAPAPAPTNTVTTSTDYTVVSGDTLSKIAKQFGTSVKEIKSLNQLKSDLILVGQVLKVSSQAAVVPPPPVTVPQTPQEPQAPLAPDTQQTTPSAPAAAEQKYIVKGGDTLSKIAGQYGITYQLIKKHNGLTSDMIYIGQSLMIPTTSTPVSPPKNDDFAQSFITTAKSLMGTPYAWGGSSLSGFDCSGFIYYAANQAGKSMGRYSAEGYYSRTFYVDQPQPGDLIFFENTYKKGISHVGIYLGNNEFIHADEKKGVSISNLSNPYYTAHFDGFKRFY